MKRRPDIKLDYTRSIELPCGSAMNLICCNPDANHSMQIQITKLHGGRPYLNASEILTWHPSEPAAVEVDPLDPSGPEEGPRF